MNKYYVYIYLHDEDSDMLGYPYYVGKGCGNRAFTPHSNVEIPNNIANIIIVENNLLQSEAYVIERELIRFWGRLDIRTGIL
jgi:hypothetical protein